MNGNFIYDLINKPNIKIADLGCGKLPQYFYHDGLDIDSYDMYQDNPDFKNFKKENILKLYEKPELKHLYSVVILNHVFEHIKDLESLFKSINHILKPSGILYCSIPNGYGFTDIFYRLIHRYDNGGHVNKWSKDDFINLVENNNFEYMYFDYWADDFVWLEKCFDLNYNQCPITKEEILYLVNVFRLELTPEKEYYYGWEFVFRKVS